MMGPYPISPAAERRMLQLAVLVGGAVPVLAGGSVVLEGVLAETAGNIAIDSHARYLSGLLLGIGLAFWSFIPVIERRTAEVRLLTAIIFIGGIARVISLLSAGRPGVAMEAAIVMELVITPMLCLWQGRIARRFQSQL